MPDPSKRIGAHETVFSPGRQKQFHIIDVAPPMKWGQLGQHLAVDTPNGYNETAVPPMNSWQLWLKAHGSRLKAQGSRLKAQGSRLKAQGSRLMAQGSWLIRDITTMCSSPCMNWGQLWPALALRYTDDTLIQVGRSRIQRRVSDVSMIRQRSPNAR